MNETNTDTNIVHRFNSVNERFLQEIESLRETLPLMMILLEANEKRAAKTFSSYIKENGKENTNEKGEKVYTFSAENSYYVEAFQENAQIASTATKIIPQSLFVSLISQFDSFLGNLIREIFLVRPELLNSSERNLSYSKLIGLKSIDEAKELIIEKEVESILRESHSLHFEWLENKLGMTLKKDLPIWPTFIEITERRNLFAHCDGIISSQYLSNCKLNNVIFDAERKLSEKLDVSPDYFELAYKCLFEISVKLTQVIWRKLLPNDLENADKALNDICFDLITNRQYEIADTLLDFATSILKKHFSDETKTIFVINKVLSLKLGGKKEHAEKILKAKDFSALSNRFKIAREVLLDNYEEVGKLMKIIGSDGEVKKLHYRTWPLFREFRKTKIFTDCYKEIFGEEFIRVETPKKLLEQILHSAEQAKINNKAKEAEKVKILNSNTFLETANKLFPNYQFIPYKVDSFIYKLLQVNAALTSEEFTTCMERNIKTIERFNQDITVLSPNQYLNPYTMIRHCLYLSNKENYKNVLYEIQRKSFDQWLEKLVTIPENSPELN